MWYVVDIYKKNMLGWDPFSPAAGISPMILIVEVVVKVNHEER